MFQFSVHTFDEIEREFGPDLNGFLPVVVNNLSQRGRPLPLSELGSVHQFGKGYDRLKSWLNLAGLNPNPRYNGLSQFWSPITNELITIKSLNQLDKLQKIFCLSAFIVYFQVFGDGNHRAANYFFTTVIGRELSDAEKNIIHDIHETIDYSLMTDRKDNYVKYVNGLLENTIQGLITRFNKTTHLSRQSNGGKRTRYTGRKTLRIRKNRKNRNNRNNRKSRRYSRK
jgi:hypothetical protein